MIRKLLIANRGEIACRIARTCRRMGIAYVAVYSDADAGAPHLAGAAQTLRLGPAPAAQSYLNAERIVAAAVATSCDAVHPGYGFLSENADFARAVEAAGLIFVGPRPETIALMGDKDRAKAEMAGAGVPVVPGSDHASDDTEEIVAMVATVGRPALLKPVAGGGGKGMTVIGPEMPDADLAAAASSSVRTARAAFGDGRLLVERYLTGPRHVEVQVFGDGQGNVVHMFERECSLQRRHQKVIEEAPAATVDPAIRAALTEAAVTGAAALRYRNAGTFEFILGQDGTFAFLEVNTRLQVEHPVTEEITGLDLVEWQLRIAGGEGLPLPQERIACTGHAVECRIYAEDPRNGFRPSPGLVRHLRWPGGVRVESSVVAGTGVPPDYDPMLAKLVTRGATRDAALGAMKQALEGTAIFGLHSNVGFLRALLDRPEVAGGTADTTFVDREIGALLAGDTAAGHAVAAGAMALAQRAAVTPCSPWRDAAGSDRARLSPDAPFGRISLASDGDRRLMRILDLSDTGATVAGEGAAHDIALTPGSDPAMGIVTGHAGGVDFAAMITDTRVELLLGGYRHVLDVMPGAVEMAVAGGEIRSEMPGLVVAVPVRQGERVSAGTTLAVVEAMKMETPIRAPVDGVVAELACAMGDQLRAGDLVARIEVA
ncbi:MAG: acetyl/propionyl/methylcrotonyl-CoA carboxylase subunit alpha [Pseudooceanicola nanhaiensis]|uniref:acetyl/propionyl/methylcrotonyl-CoA carboxylase subunit alpha n=1 Tax=Rhodobacterales TaxID=204455 RepID=UPI0040584DE5